VNEFRRLLTYARPYRGRMLLGVFAMAVYAAGNFGQAYLVKLIFDGILIPSEDNVRWIIQLLLLTYLVKGIGTYGSSVLMTDVGQRVVRDIRTRLYDHILNQSAAFFSRWTSGQLLSRINNDVGQIQNAASETIADLIRESLTVLVLAVYLVWLDANLAVICIAVVPLVVYPLVRLGHRVRSTTRRGQEHLEHLTHLASEGLTGHRIVKAFGAESREVARFASAGAALYRTNMRITSAMSALPPLMEFMGGLAAAGLLFYAAKKIQLGELSPGAFASFLTSALMMYAPIKKLSRVNAGLQQAIAASQRIFAMLDTHTEVKERPGATPLARVRDRVEFRDAGFAYDDRPDTYVLRHVSFTVNAGQVVAIVGLSGAGKTTLVNLIPRFYDVTEGALLMDGVDVRDVTLASLRAQIALVTQETVLFDDTIAANIAYGAPTASRSEIEAAAKAAHAHEFIEKLVGAYDARIGERGQRLSGGQRQRLAIARAILTNAPLLVLDEATSALDSESEQLVQDALVNLMRNRTTFVIAHRLSTVRNADLIVALEHGVVAEVGSHEDLVNRPGGVYARLHALQVLDDRNGEEHA
jgi:subfamily B ATP-binding cassette protein MsbA